MVLVPLAARDAAESLQKAPNSVVSGGRQRRRESLTVPVPPAHPLLPDALPKRSIWVSITAQNQAARQLPGLSIIIRVDPSSPGVSRLRGALPQADILVVWLSLAVERT